MNLSPLQQLEPGAAPHTWTSTGFDPQFLLSVSLPRGWVELSLSLSGIGGEQAEIFWDTGSGFNAVECLTIKPDAGGCIEHKFLCRLPKPVCAVRLDPLSKPGTFELRRFEIHARSNVAAIVNTLRPLLGRPHPNSFTRAWITPPDSLAAVPVLTSAQRGELYARWLAGPQRDAAERSGIQTAIAAWRDPPLISVLMPVFNPPAEFLKLAIASVSAQLYPHWELCIADDASTQPHVRAMLESAARADRRIRCVFRKTNGNVCAASDSAFELARGRWVALLDHDDELSTDALYWIAQAIRAEPAADMLYSDEDKLSVSGERCDPFFKPCWSPEYALATVYTGHLAVFRAALLRELGGFRPGYDFAQDQDLVLRMLARHARVVHVPRVLYHWRMHPGSAAADAFAKPSGHDAGRRALEDYLRATGQHGIVESEIPNIFRVRFALRDTPKVSILIPTAYQAQPAGEFFIERCLRSIRALTSYSNFELFVAASSPPPRSVACEFDAANARHIGYSDPFNWSRVNNFLAAQSAGAHLLFLNDDTEVRNADWLQALLEFSQHPDIGAVGAKLFFPDGRLQHIGVTFIHNGPDHLFQGYPGTHGGYFASALLHRNCAAVTGACLMTRREIFDSVGGFSEEFPLDYGDVDYCLKLRRADKRIVFTPHARLTHCTSATRTAGHDAAALQLLIQKWPAAATTDPYHNPQLSLNHNDSRLAP